MPTDKTGPCETCGNIAVLVADTGLCGPCCFGEASSLEDYPYLGQESAEDEDAD